MKYSKMMSSTHLKLALLLSEFIFSLRVSAETAVESGANTFPKFTSKHEYILTDTKHGYILTDISYIKHEYVLTNLFKKPAQSKASIFSPSLISANFSSDVN